MAAIADSAPSLDSHHTAQCRKKRKKNRFLKQGYHKSERHDARRVAAKAFLSGITRDSHLQRRGVASEEALSVPYSPGPTSIASRKTLVFPDDVSLHLQPPTPGAELLAMPGTAPTKLCDMPLDIFQSSPTRATSKGWEQADFLNTSLVQRTQSTVEALSSSPWRHARLLGRTHSIGTADTPALVIPCRSLQPYEEMLGGSRVVLSTRRIPFAVCSVLPYSKHEEKLRLDHPRERMRVRTNSISLQLDLELDGLELGDCSTEVSLAFLLSPVWVLQDSSPIDLPDTPLLVRRKSSVNFDLDRSSIASMPRPRSGFHGTIPEHPSTSGLFGATFPWQLQFQDNHSPAYVVLNYHPLALDNYAYFIGKNTTTITPCGYMVSIIEYCKASDVKKGINQQFGDVYPFIKLTLTKLRSIKKSLYRIAMESEVDLVVVAYAYVYYEKLVLMGKVTKPIRKVVAGVCLLLAAKFSSDMKKLEIIALIDRITDVFRISSKEVLLYEFPVLALLQFSLLTPDPQVQPHYERLRELEQS